MARMATNLGPDDFERDLDAVLTDPTFQQHLDDLDRQRERGEIVEHSHDAVLKRLGLRDPGEVERESP